MHLSGHRKNMSWNSEKQFPEAKHKIEMHLQISVVNTLTVIIINCIYLKVAESTAELHSHLAFLGEPACKTMNKLKKNWKEEYSSVVKDEQNAGISKDLKNNTNRKSLYAYEQRKQLIKHAFVYECVFTYKEVPWLRAPPSRTKIK